jgi:hypothetical protein
MYGKMKIEKIKNKYFLTLKNNELNNIFISSFLFTAKDFLDKYNYNSEEKEIKIHLLVDKVESLPEYLNTNKIDYATLEKLHFNLNLQLTNLHNNGMGVIKFSPKDIFILYNEDDTYFVLLNNENLTTVDSNNNLVLKKTIKDSDYTAPELNKIKKIPTVLKNKCSIWSLGSVLNYCLKKYNDELIITNIEKDENIENKIKNSKLFWTIKRCLKRNPKHRFSLLI